MSSCKAYLSDNRLRILSYLRSRQLEVFGSCTDSQVESMGPQEYCQAAVEPVIDFWDMDDKTCLEVSFSHSDRCAEVIGKVFSQVEALILATT